MKNERKLCLNLLRALQEAFPLTRKRQLIVVKPSKKRTDLERERNFHQKKNPNNFAKSNFGDKRFRSAFQTHFKHLKIFLKMSHRSNLKEA